MSVGRVILYLALAALIGSTIILSVSTACRRIVFPFTPKSKWQPLKAEMVEGALQPTCGLRLIPVWAACVAASLCVYVLLRRRLAS